MSRKAHVHDHLTNKITKPMAGPQRHYEIQAREPWELPTQTVEIPPPPRMPAVPAAPNLLSMMLGPVLMIVMYGAMFAYQSSQAGEDGLAISPVFFMMPMIGIVQPIAAWFSYRNQKKKYGADMQAREGTYAKTLAEIREGLEVMAAQQRELLNREYPLLPRLVSTGLGTAHKKRLWWRRAADPDFLSLRMGSGEGRASFAVSPPRFNDPEDPLAGMASELQQAFINTPDIPLLLELQKVGSVALAAGSGGEWVYGMACRLMLDLMVNHSPLDVELVLLADAESARDRWGWLKWTPHTRSLHGDSRRRIALDPEGVDKCMKWLMEEFHDRGKSEPGQRQRRSAPSSIVVFLDDSGDIRRTEDIRQLAAYGMEANIYLVFIGGRHWPRETRARIEVSRDEIKYVETFSGEEKGRRLRGQTDLASSLECERVARHLAGLEVSSVGGSGSLPENVRLSEVLVPANLALESIRTNWEKSRDSDELLQFPFGLRKGRKGLIPATLNLLPPPPDFTGLGSYHTILVGTTGSGKSELMKSIVLSAAHKYSPRLLNFFFMDFKGGAAFNDFKELPHVVGVVTNLGPQLVERGLSALDAEIRRRQNYFADGGVENIWSYNAKYPRNQMPHLMLLLDEFSRGMTEFPRLPDMLEMLGRIGRSLGMYLLLGNQNVNSAMDRLLNNVGWRIVMKTNSPEEARPLIRRLPGEKIERTGQGFLHSSLEKEDVVHEFQGAYSGFTVRDPEEDVEEAFKIFSIAEDGRAAATPIFTNTKRLSAAEKERHRPKEQEHLIGLMKDLAREYEPAQPIYLEPLEAVITLEEVLQDSQTPVRYTPGGWRMGHGAPMIKVPIGYTDSTEQCLQSCMEVDFGDQDGHLWLIGGPSSGKAMTIDTILLSLAMANTPRQVWFYLLEFGTAGTLRHFNSLPHCGAIIGPKDPPEMLERLLKFLEEEVSRRASHKGQAPEIFLVINNFMEFRNAYPDHADRIAPFLNGKSMGIHLIISTNRRIELPNKLALARKIILRLANRDEYSDAVGGRVSLLPTLQSEGRGLWLDGSLLECQIAQPVLEMDGSRMDLERVCSRMADSWSGDSAPKIRLLPSQIPLQDLLEKLPHPTEENFPFPIGVSYENLQIVPINLIRDIPRWLVVGSPRSGKTNFLINLAATIHHHGGGEWEILYLSLRRPIPEPFNQEKIKTAGNVQAAIVLLTDLLGRIEDASQAGRRILFLFDDLGAAFEPGREALGVALNNLALIATSHDNIILIGAGSPEEMRPHQMTSQFLRVLKQSRMGIAFSKEPGDLEFLTAPPLSLLQKRMELMAGRGYWVYGGKSILVQSPWSG